MAFSITDIENQLALGGARPTLFNVTLTSPPGGVGASAAAIAKAPFMIQAASIPQDEIGVIQVPYFGRKIKTAGDRTYSDWNIQVLCDEDFLLRNFFETWMAAINSPIGNLRTFGSAADSQYKATALVEQFSKTGVIIRSYEIQNCWPTRLGEIELAWANNNTIEVFPVSFAFDDFIVQPGLTGDGGGE